jgi:poly(A) polymerase
MTARPAGLVDVLADDSPVMRLAERFVAVGHSLYLVGGSVRDALMGRVDSSPDLDFATDAEPEEIKGLVAPLADAVWLQGMEFGTVGAAIAGVRMEITTFRTERYETGSRHPSVEFESDISADLSRRDFTINAMAVRLPDKVSVDPFGGVDDLKARVIRTPGPPEASFTDDPLRMLRAFRFASQLEFRIEESVLAAIEGLRNEIETVSAERIRDELIRLLTGRAPAAALKQADATGITDLFLPELGALKLQQDPVHRHKDVFHHTLAVVERTDRTDHVLRFAALLHDIGKPKTRRIGPEGVSFHHHEVVGADMAERRLRALRFDNATVHDVHQIIRLHHRFHTYRLGWTDSAVRRYVKDAGPLLGKLNALVRADCTTRNAAKAKELAARMDELEARIAELAEKEELDRLRPELDGFQVMAYLGIEPGPLVKEALDFMLELRMEEGILGEEEAYKRLDEWARARGIDLAGERVPKREKPRADE